MVYSRDQWVQLPVRDLYDSQIMLASINAARDMYQRGVDEMKEFKREYGDFYSPIQKDMDWYTTNVTQGMRDTIEDLYARGIDPLRSAEGRAIISRRINNAPIGEINKLKMASKTAQEYLKNRGVLEAQGRYNKDYEDFVNGGKTIEDWDTLKDGIWTRQAPSQFMTLKEATENWYNNRTPHSLTQKEVEGFGVKYDKRYNYTGFTKDDLLGIAAKNTPGWNGSQIADYYRNVAKNQLLSEGIENPTNQQIEYRLQQNVAAANDEYKIKPIEQVNQYAMLDKQQAYQTQARREGFAHDRKMAAFNAAKQRDMAYLQWRLSNSTPDGNGNPALKNPQQQPIPLSFTEQLIESANRKKTDNIAGPKNFQANTKKISDYWLGKAYSVLSKADSNGDGKLSKDEQANWKVRYSRLSPYQKKLYDNAIHHRNWWNKVSAEGYGNAAKNGLIDKFGNVTSRFTNAMAYSDKNTGNNGYSDNERNRINSKYYNNVFTDINEEGRKQIINLLTGGNEENYVIDEKKSKFGKKHPVLNFSESGVWFGNYRAHNASTGRDLTNGSISKTFQNFLKKNKVKGWVVSKNGIGVTTVPNRGKGQSLDILANVSVPYSVLERYANSIGVGSSNIPQLIRSLGLRMMDVNGVTIDKKEDNTFVEIPVSKQIDNNGGQGYGQVDTSYDKSLFGGKEAAAREIQRQYKSSQTR